MECTKFVNAIENNLPNKTDEKYTVVYQTPGGQNNLIKIRRNKKEVNEIINKEFENYNKIEDINNLFIVESNSEEIFFEYNLENKDNIYI